MTGGSGSSGSAATARPWSRRGRNTRNVAPCPGALSRRTPPPTLAHDADDDREAEAAALALGLGGEERLEDALPASPRPCPRPCRARSAGRTRRARIPRPRWRPASATAVSMVRMPPSGIASRALSARFSSTCSSCVASAWIRPTPGVRRSMHSIRWPSRRRRSGAARMTTSLRLSGVAGGRSSRRMASRWLARSAACWLASRISRA